jgi:hypothetical protein
VENKINTYMVLVGKLEGKRPRGRPVRGLEGNINVDLKKISVDWINLAVDGDNWRAVLTLCCNLGFYEIPAVFLDR